MDATVRSSRFCRLFIALLAAILAISMSVPMGVAWADEPAQAPTNDEASASTSEAADEATDATAEGGDPATAALAADEGGVAAQAATDDVSYKWYTDNTGDTYTISTVADLKGLAKITQNKAATTQDGNIPADDFAGKKVLLGGNIDLAGTPWFAQTIENGTVTTTADHRIKDFSGIFDGQGHTIKNLSFVGKGQGEANEAGAQMGLFRSVATSGVVKNLMLEGVMAELGTNDVFAPLVRTLSGKAEDCHVKSVVISKAEGVEGGSSIGASGSFYTVGPNASVKGCSVTGLSINMGCNVRLAGGMAALANAGASFENCLVANAKFNRGAENGAMGGIAGFCGQTQNGSNDVRNNFKNCHVEGLDMVLKGEMGGTDNYVPSGFVACLGNGANIENCSVQGSVDASRLSCATSPLPVRPPSTAAPSRATICTAAIPR